MSRRLRAGGTSPALSLRPRQVPGISGLAGRPPSLVPMSAVIADGYRRRVLAAGAQGPVIGVVGENDAIGAQLVDQSGRIIRSGQMRCTAAAAARCAGIADEQDADGGQVQQDLVLADIGILRRPGPGAVALAWPWRHR